MYYSSCNSTYILPFVKNHPEMIIILAEGQGFNNSRDKHDLPRAGLLCSECIGVNSCFTHQARGSLAISKRDPAALRSVLSC